MAVDDRYQFQPWYVKAYRQIRHSPYGWFEFTRSMMYWALSGFEVPEPESCPWHKNRRTYIAHIWTCYRSMAQYRMGAWWTTKELIQKYTRD